MAPNTPSSILTFVPAKDFERSTEFYKALGFQSNDDQDVRFFSLGSCGFLLQDYYVKDWANNFMFHVDVEDAHAWHTHASKVIAEGNFDYARLNEPKLMDYGPIVTHVWDPSGVLLHFAQWEHDQS